MFKGFTTVLKGLNSFLLRPFRSVWDYATPPHFFKIHTPSISFAMVVEILALFHFLYIFDPNSICKTTETAEPPPVLHFCPSPIYINFTFLRFRAKLIFISLIPTKNCFSFSYLMMGHCPEFSRQGPLRGTLFIFIFTTTSQHQHQLQFHHVSTTSSSTLLPCFDSTLALPMLLAHSFFDGFQ